MQKVVLDDHAMPCWLASLGRRFVTKGISLIAQPVLAGNMSLERVISKETTGVSEKGSGLVWSIT